MLNYQELSDFLEYFPPFQAILVERDVFMEIMVLAIFSSGNPNILRLPRNHTQHYVVWANEKFHRPITFLLAQRLLHIRFRPLKFLKLLVD